MVVSKHRKNMRRTAHQSGSYCEGNEDRKYPWHETTFSADRSPARCDYPSQTYIIVLDCQTGAVAAVSNATRESPAGAR
jgi:hypothetical protein